MVKWTDEGKPKLNFVERMKMRSILKNLAKIEKEIINIKEVKKQKELIANSIMDLVDILDIKNPETGEKATTESLQEMPLDELIDLYDEVVGELKKTV